MSLSLSYPDLAQRVIDLDRLMLRPAAGERAGLASSYDRASVYDAVNDRYLDWGANADGTGVVRMEGSDAVLADIEGPGCIWRIWSATVGAGHVRIYLDGATEPAVDIPFAGFFDRQHAPFDRPNLVYKTAAQGYNNYTPISFQRSCRIVAAPGWGKYYHFNYTRFPADWRVPTFRRELSAADAAALDQVNAVLGRAGQNHRPAAPEQRTLKVGLQSRSGTRAQVADLRGPQVIRGLRVRVSLPADPTAQRVRLRQVAVRVHWDNAEQPAVWSPLGDFFGSSAGAAPFRTLPVGLLEDGTFYCFWSMPFFERAQLFVDNDGPDDLALAWEIDHAPLTRPNEECLLFHAKWHRDVLPVRADRQPDWTVLQSTGCGRYVGTQLHVWNPRGGWWGEGDEKFFVDGEKFPSVFGTGTEDYLGYAWSSGNTFVQALHSQPVNEQNRGHVSANRWHVPDDVPFQRSFDGSIEKYFPNSNPCHWAAVAYWYLDAGGIDPLGPVPVSERVDRWTIPPIRREPGVIEADELPVLRQHCEFAGSPLDAVARNIAPGVISGDRFLMWWVDKVGLRLELGGILVQQPGRYRLLARFVRDPEMGQIQFDLDGAKVGAPVDLYASGVGGSPVVDEPEEIGVATLAAGEHQLGMEVVGRNPASRGHLMGVDYFKLLPVP